MWVDSDDCKPFIEGILTAFGTKMPSRYAVIQVWCNGRKTSLQTPIFKPFLPARNFHFLLFFVDCRSTLLLMSDPTAAKSGGAGNDPTNGGSRHASPAPQAHAEGGEGEETTEVRASRESTPGADKNAVVQTR